MAKEDPVAARQRRHLRVRGKVTGTSSKPRLNVFRSLNHIYTQVIDDVQGRTLVAASTLDPEVKAALDGKTKTAGAELVGALIAKRALNQGVTQVTFDRGGFKYHGRVKALAEAARQGGLKF